MSTFSSIFNNPFRGILTLTTACGLMHRVGGENIARYVDLKRVETAMNRLLNFWSLQEVCELACSIKTDCTNYIGEKTMQQIPQNRSQKNYLVLKVLFKISKIVAAGLSLQSWLKSIHAIERQSPIAGVLEDLTAAVGFAGTAYFILIDLEEEKKHHMSSMLSLAETIALFAACCFSLAFRFEGGKKLLHGRLDNLLFSMNFVAVASMLVDHFNPGERPISCD